MRSIILLIICIAITHVVSAQQDPLYGLYPNNPIAINPAYAGLNNNLTIYSTYRKQWGDFAGSPLTMNAGAHASIWQNRLSAGLMIVSDRIGENINTQTTAQVGYKIPLDSKGTILSFGLQGGMINYRSNTDQLTIRDGGDKAFASFRITEPTLGAGMMVKGDKFLFGVSIPRLVNGAIRVGDERISVYQQHFYITGSYLFHMSERLVLKPSTLLKVVKGAPLSADVNVMAILDRNYGAGILIRNLNTVGLMLQLAFFDKYRLAYVMEIPTGRSIGSNYTTHELMLSMRLRVLNGHDYSQSNF